MNWQAILAVILGTSFMAFFVKLYSDYKDQHKKIIDLEYKNEKSEVKEAVKNDSIDSVIDRIRKRFR